MNRTALGPLALALLLTASWSVMADETDALREECRTVAEGHGVSGEQLDSWIQRCIENTSKIRKEMKEGDRHDGNGHGGGEGSTGGHGH